MQLQYPYFKHLVPGNVRTIYAPAIIVVLVCIYTRAMVLASGKHTASGYYAICEFSIFI